MFVSKRVPITRGEIQVVDEGTGLPILLVHGFPLNHTMWREQIQQLATTHRVIAPDLLGFGGSSAVRENILTMRSLADDLAELLTALKETRPVVFCGLSMGGYAGWQFVEHYRRLTKALVALDTRAAADSPEQAKGRLTAAVRLEKEGNEFLVESMLPRLFGENLAKTRTSFVEETRLVMLATSAKTCAAAQRGMAERPDMTAQLPSFDLPALILCGENDIISPAKEMREIATTMPNAKYIEIAGAGHMTTVEKPNEVNAALSAFLASLG